MNKNGNESKRIHYSEENFNFNRPQFLHANRIGISSLYIVFTRDALDYKYAKNQTLEIIVINQIFKAVKDV